MENVVLLENLDFNVVLTKQTTSAIGLSWTFKNREKVDFDLYKLEKCFSNNFNNWNTVYWGSGTKYIIINLEQNLCYSFRLNVLKHLDGSFEYVKQSDIFKTYTLPDIPSPLSLYRAVKKSLLHLIRSFLSTKPDLVNYPFHGQSLLYVAVINNNLEVTNVLLEHGANVDVGVPANLVTPLHMAFYNKNMKIAALLIEHGANVFATNCIGMTIAHYAIDSNDLYTLRYSLAQDLSIETKDRCGWTLIYRAIIMKTDISIIKYLLDRKCKLKIKDNNKLSPLAFAKISNWDEVVRLLESRLKL